MQAIILAGGFGTRLKPVVSGVPKPMAPVGGQPFLHWLLDYMAEQGVREAVLCLHHQSDIISDYFGERFGPMRLHYLLEKTPLGTGGAIRKAMHYLEPSEPVFALNGDSLVELDYPSMIAAHLASGRPLTIATRPVADCSRYSQLLINPLPPAGEPGEGGLISRYDVLGQPQPGEISAGLYVLSPDIFERFQPAVARGLDLPPAAAPKQDYSGFAEGSAESWDEGAFSFERDFLAPHAPKLLPAAFRDVRYFIDIGVPEDYARGQNEIPARLMERAVA